MWQPWHAIAGLIREAREAREARRAVQIEAGRMIGRHGAAAYDIARERARDVRSGRLIDQRSAGHWDRVRREIGRRIGHEPGSPGREG